MGNGFANPGFETGSFVYWSAYTNGFEDSKIKIATRDKYAGDFSTYMYCDAPFGTSVCSISQPILLNGATHIIFHYKIHELSLSEGGDESGRADINVYIGGELWKTKSITATTGWRTFQGISPDLIGVYEIKIEYTVSTHDDIAYSSAYFDDFVSSVDSSGSYTIASLSDLEKMADDVYGTYTLIQDIDASDTQLSTYNDGKGWAPIGSISQPFKGTLDGAGYKITGLEINDETANYKGLFGFTANDCVIKNLEIEPTIIKGKEVVGTLAGIVVGTDIDNITISGGTVYGTAFTGGAIGTLYDSTLDNCTVTASIAENDTTVDESFGGIVGLSKGSTMNTMIYTGTSINVPNKTDVGGIMGRALAISGTGLLVSLIKGYVKTNITGKDGIGGIFGYIELGVVDQCQFIGNVTGNTYVGGVFGDSYGGTISNCAAGGGTTTANDYAGGLNGYCTIGVYTNSYAAMEIACEGSNKGALSGGFSDSTAEAGSYVDEDVATVPASNSYQGRTTTQMTNINDPDTYEPEYGWDWDDIWGGAVDLISDYAYPVLRWLAQHLYTNFFVKTDGDDRESGISWSSAWKTVNLAMNTVIDGKTLHIGYGTYDSEPTDNKIAPQNIGSAGIKVICENDDGSGQTSGGEVRIKVN